MPVNMETNRGKAGLMSQQFQTTLLRKIVFFSAGRAVSKIEDGARKMRSI